MYLWLAARVAGGPQGARNVNPARRLTAGRGRSVQGGVVDVVRHASQFARDVHQPSDELDSEVLLPFDARECVLHIQW